jgi:hypothetical protein
MKTLLCIIGVGLVSAVILQAQIVVAPPPAPPVEQRTTRRITVPAAFALGVVSQARGAMPTNSIAVLPSTNEWRLIGVSIRESGSNQWSGVLEYQRK